jgi:Family of unknown function (DUF6644)
MSVLSFFQWCAASALGAAIRDSRWLFPVIEAVHLLGLALMGGFVLLVDMRLMGLAMPRTPVAALAREIQPWLVSALAVMLTTGLLLYTSEATKLYYNMAFWMKMGFLSSAIVYTFTVRRAVLAADESRVGPVWGKLVALVSIALWAGVGIGGRAIGFY